MGTKTGAIPKPVAAAILGFLFICFFFVLFCRFPVVLGTEKSTNKFPKCSWSVNVLGPSYLHACTTSA